MIDDQPCSQRQRQRYKMTLCWECYKVECHKENLARGVKELERVIGQVLKEKKEKKGVGRPKGKRNSMKGKYPEKFRWRK